MVKVVTLSKPKNPVNTLASIARVCYNKNDKYYSEKENMKLLTKIVKAGHWSILEHLNYTFLLVGSRNFTHQLVRHRHMSFTQQSLHFTILDKMEISKEVQTLSVKQQKRMNKIAQECYKEYRKLIKEGVPREIARHIIPSGVLSKIIVTSNLREWAQFLNIRLCFKNCKEIQNAAYQIKNIILKDMPFLKGFIGTPCELTGYCPEIKSCGRINAKKNN